MGTTLLKDKLKWYSVINGCIFLVTSIIFAIDIYVETTFFNYYYVRLYRVLGYILFTSGFSALIFGVLSFFKPESVKDKAKWYGVVSACVFMVASTYMLRTAVFYDTRLPWIIFYLEFTTALSSLIFGLLSFPKWQSYVALAVWVYSFYRFSEPPLSVG